MGTGLSAAVLEGFTIVNGFMVEPQEPTRTQSGDLHDLSGAGIAVRNFNSVTIRNCVIRDCVTQFTGGGISVELGANARIENCVVTGCSAGIFGGGFTLETSADATIINSVFTGNTSTSGAGAHFGSGAAQVEGSLFAGNWSANRGGGVYVALFAGVRMERSVTWNNCASEGPDVWIEPTTGVPDRGSLEFACSIIDTSGVTDEGGFVLFLADNVFNDPLFCAPGDCQQAPTNVGDYGLDAASPALPGNSPCGAAIGPSSAGCVSSVTGSSWSRLKSLYRGDRSGR